MRFIAISGLIVDMKYPGTIIKFIPITVCTPGEYYALPNDPSCTKCECGSNGQPTDVCRATGCPPQVCPNGVEARHIPGTCCEYEPCPTG